jgi:hypothetical protein
MIFMLRGGVRAGGPVRVVELQPERGGEGRVVDQLARLALAEFDEFPASTAADFVGLDAGRR